MSEQDWIERLRERAPINLLRRPMTDAAGANDLWPLLCDVVEAADFARDGKWMPADLRWQDYDAAIAALRAEVEK